MGKILYAPFFSQTRSVKALPAFKGKACGKEEQTVPCTKSKAKAKAGGACPVDSQMSPWTNSGDCSVSCGSGVQKQTRTILAQPKDGGQHLETKRSVTCVKDPCPVDCKVGPWQSGSCCKGKQNQTRETLVPAAFKGKPCPALTEEKDCDGDPCGGGGDDNDFGTEEDGEITDSKMFLKKDTDSDMDACKEVCGDEEKCRSLFVKNETCVLVDRTKAEAGPAFKKTKDSKFVEKAESGEIVGAENLRKRYPNTGNMDACKKKCAADLLCKSYFMDKHGNCQLAKLTKKEAGKNFKHSKDKKFADFVRKSTFSDPPEEGIIVGAQHHLEKLANTNFEACKEKCSVNVKCKSFFVKKDSTNCQLCKVTKEEAGADFKKEAGAKFAQKLGEPGEIVGEKFIAEKIPNVQQLGDCIKKCKEKGQRACKSLFLKGGTCHLAKVTKAQAGPAFKKNPQSLFHETAPKFDYT